jgi:VWFA-related protein
MITRTALVVSLALLALGQDNQAPRPAQTDPLIRVDTRLVEVNVVVRDNNGPITGLVRDDFSVFDNGQRQQITAFSIKTGRLSSTSRPLPAGAISNRLDPSGEEPSEASVILWDMLNTEVIDQAWVRTQVLTYLRTMQPGDRVALYGLVKSLRVMRDFTDDPDLLRRAVSVTGPQQSVNLSAGDLGNMAGQMTFLGDPADEAAVAAFEDMQAASLTAAMEMQWYSLKDRSLITLAALRAIADHLQGLPGRKKLIWVSGGFPTVSQQLNTRLGAQQIESLNVGLQVQKAIERLNDANVAVYPIDPRGLTIQNTAQGFGANNPAGTFTGGLALPGIDTMNLFASGTGGRAFYGTNDVVGAIRETFEDFVVTYTLGFYPGEKLDGKYHALSVKVNRKGAQVRSRKGYFATDVRVTSDIMRQNALNATMQNELEATGVGIIALTEPIRERPGRYQIELSIDAHDLYFQEREGHWLSWIDFATHFSGTPTLSGTVETILVSLNEERFREVLQEGLKVRREVDLADQTGQLRIAIQDRASGRAGSVLLRLTGNQAKP